MSLTGLTIIALAVLAFANGSNDVSKGIATLAGSGRATYRQALAWGTFWTAAGAFASVAIAFGLVKTFTTALVSPAVLADPAFPVAAASGAAAWVLVASVTGLPVSTTHALTGAIVGVAAMSGGAASVRWPLFASAVAAPLALSPIVSAAIAFSVHSWVGRTSTACVCVDQESAAPVTQADGTIVLSSLPMPAMFVSRTGCEAEITRRRLVAGDVAHWAAAAALSFARGVNDNPKIAAIGTLAVVSFGAGESTAFTIAALAMSIGSITAGLRVSRTLGERVVDMDGETGVASALVASGLVLAASFYTLPVSTTHVATGAIVGAGVRQGVRTVRWRMVASLLAAWVITFPVAAMLGAVANWLIRLLA